MNCSYIATGVYTCTQSCTSKTISESFQNAQNIERFEGECDAYQDNETVSSDCYQQIWSDSGCTTPMQHNDWSKTQTKQTLVSDSKAWATLTGSHHRNGCYGSDKSNWPNSCDGPDDKPISRECYQQIWNDSGCTTTITEPQHTWAATQTKQTLVGDSKAWATLTDPHHREGCYGNDKSKWPSS